MWMKEIVLKIMNKVSTDKGIVTFFVILSFLVVNGSIQNKEKVSMIFLLN